ncbi:MAG: cell envelope integrity protein TolA [Deltaproteobacteria bacterium]|nr:cell envelope integrity protein TolA [Deltaproteobacteria bacterium]
MKTSPNIDVWRSLSKNPRIEGMILISLLLHMVVISAMFFLPNLASSRTFYSPVYSVRLVEAPANFPPVREEVRKPSPEAAPSKSPPVGGRAKGKEKGKPISLSPSQDDTEKKIEEAIARIRQRRESESIDTAIESIRQRRESKSIDTAIERLRSEKEVRQLSSAIEGIRQRVTIGSSGAVAASEAATGGASSGIMSIKFKLYYNLLWQRIRSVWVLPEEALGGKKDLETIIAIRIAKDGQIEDIQFEKKSGNHYLDESALRAIKKANPLPPLPPGMEEDKFDLGVRFKPSDF